MEGTQRHRNFSAYPLISASTHCTAGRRPGSGCSGSTSCASNGEAAAAQLVVDHGNRLWGLKTGYDERFRRVSPGLLLMQDILREACERGYEAVEFLGAAEPYKAIWTDRQRDYCSIRLYPMLSPLGGLALGQDLAAFARRRAARRDAVGHTARRREILGQRSMERKAAG